MKRFLGALALAAAGATIGVGTTQYFSNERYSDLENKVDLMLEKNRLVTTNFTANPARNSTGATLIETPNFIEASAMATPAVVHVQSYFKGSSQSDPWAGLFGSPNGMRQGQASGSGVIISADGFITTNNHVIERADRIEVVLEDKRSFEAELIGRDPTTDLALLKIEEEALPYLSFANSDDVAVGEWVLAVGNPFNLTSTVTAGIVSAKGRSLNLLDDEFAIESFIQTDAAVNPGNSGGALINASGQLVGINTAIASETGSFAGYSFAVPVNIVRKVMRDLREFGEVQRGIIGVQIRDINANMAREMDISTLNGAYVTGTIPGGAAQDAGIERGDVIVKVDGFDITGSASLQEIIGTFRPGDKVNVGILRENRPIDIEVILRNREGTTGMVYRQPDPEPRDVDEKILDIEFEPISRNEMSNLGIDNGVKVARVGSGKLKDVGIEPGFIITRVNKEYVENADDVRRILKSSDGGILLEGITESGKRQFFAFD